jgi:hypothetical protein
MALKVPTQLLETAIKLGEKHSDENVRLANKLRKVLYKLYHIKALLKSGRPSEAADQLDYCIRLITEEREQR